MRCCDSGGVDGKFGGPNQVGNVDGVRQHG
jgi:hypothetical protein